MLEFVGILLFALVIGLSIALHELGHLLPAKAFGVKVTESSTDSPCASASSS